MNHPVVLVESLRCEHGALLNVGGHNRRLNASRKELFGMTDAWDLAELIDIPSVLGPGIYKCRVVYAEKIIKVEFLPYAKKTVTRLRIVADDAIAYPHKYKDRSALDRLRTLAGADEDIIIVRNGLVTDSSAGNLVFDTGSELLTPASPLLRGTRREFLLSRNILKPAAIRQADLLYFKSVHLINAMLDLGETALPVSAQTIVE